MKLPAFQFYPADWRKDPGVQSLSFHDRGVWFEILCLMHESEQRGKLLLNGKPMPDDALARLLGLDKQNLTKTLTTLLEYGVASRDEEGALMNRRMVRDEELRKIRQESGKLGGNPVLVKQNSTKTEKGVNQKSTPSSSSSSSSSISKEEREEARAPDVDFSWSENEAVQAYRRKFLPEQPLPIGVQDQIAKNVTDPVLWAAALDYWFTNNYRPESVGKIISKYHELQKVPMPKAKAPVSTVPEVDRETARLKRIERDAKLLQQRVN